MNEHQDAAIKAAREVAKGLDVLVAHGDATVLQSLVSKLAPRHRSLCSCATVAEMMGVARSTPPDLIVTGVDFPDGGGIGAIIELGKDVPLPAVLVAPRRSLELVEKAMHDHVMAYLIEPVDADELEAAIMVAQARFEQFKELADEVDSLRQALDDRKTIERAKGMLMAAAKMTEEEAFSMLRRRAQDARTRLADIAQGILDHGADHKPPPAGDDRTNDPPKSKHH